MNYLPIDLDQVEDGRDGGNPEFDGEVTDQYTAEVTSPCDCDFFRWDRIS